MIWSINKELDNGRYTINGNPLRTNDFITTYTAQDRNGDRVIIKTLDGGYFQSLLPRERSGIEARFEQGGLSLSKCRNRHIVHTPRKPFQQDGLWCIALEYVEGNDLSSYTQQTRLPQDQVLRYIKQIGQGLIEVHRSNLSHLNINPNNIILRRDIDEVILIGFSFIRGNLTTISQIVAKNPNYSPIELLSTSTPDSRSDVYSLAATLYFLLTEQIPPLATDRVQSIPDTLTPQNPVFCGISPHIVEAICQGMSILQNDRPQSIQEWLNLLEQNSVSKNKIFGWDKQQLVST
jgi:eukaryotic-like serine/threonine-protein kinase